MKSPPAAISVLRRVCAALVLGSACGAVGAQWVWLDGANRKVFSDTPPPPTVPQKNILRQPGVRDSGATPAAPPVAPAGTAGAKAPAPQQNAELEKRKKELEAKEADKKKADDERVAKGKADTCERAKRSLAQLDSGVRMRTTNAQGESVYMEEKDIAAERARVQAVVNADCAP
jgi:type IV secretory pathway VirB10-like protein